MSDEMDRDRELLRDELEELEKLRSFKSRVKEIVTVSIRLIDTLPLRNALLDLDDAEGGEGRTEEFPIEPSGPFSYERTLPQSLDVERALLASILQDNGVLGRLILLDFDERYFFRDAHRKICNAMRGLKLRGYPIEPIMLAVELEKRGELDEVGGKPYLEALITLKVSEKSVEAYVKEIRDKANLRHLISVLNRFTTECYDAEELSREIYGKLWRAVHEFGSKFKL